MPVCPPTDIDYIARCHFAAYLVKRLKCNSKVRNGAVLEYLYRDQFCPRGHAEKLRFTSDNACQHRAMTNLVIFRRTALANGIAGAFLETALQSASG